MKLYMRRSLNIKGYVYTFYDDLGQQLMLCHSNYAFGPVLKQFYAPQDQFVLRQKSVLLKLRELCSWHDCPYVLYEDGFLCSCLSQVKKREHYRFFYQGCTYDIVKKSLSTAFVYRDDSEQVLITREKKGVFTITVQDMPLPLLAVVCMFADETFFNLSNRSFDMQMKALQLKQAPN